MTYGVQSTGFVAKAYQDIFDEMVTELRSEISPSLDLSSRSPMGQTIAILANQIRKMWELGQATYSAGSILSASGFALDALVALTGTTRKAAAAGSVLLTVNLDGGTTLPSGSIAGVPGNSEAQFQTFLPVSNGGGSPADFVTPAICINPGPIVANAGTITSIITPVTGWNSVTNILDAVEGTAAESDAALRLRQQNDLFTLGFGTLGDIEASVAGVANVQSVFVAENTLNYEVDGLPAHSIEVVVFDNELAADLSIGTIIYASKPAGTHTHGAVSTSVIDEQGRPHTIKFSRTTVLGIYLSVDVSTSLDFPENGADLLATALADWGDENLQVGEDVILSKLCEPIFSIAGVEDIVEIRVGLASSPTQTTNFSVTPREIADLDTGRIEINVV